jgi:hypothetical protein
MDVGDWLRSLGLGQYETAFVENEIDGDLLSNLTADDLKEPRISVCHKGRRGRFSVKSRKDWGFGQGERKRLKGLTVLGGCHVPTP